MYEYLQPNTTIFASSITGGCYNPPVILEANIVVLDCKY